MIIRLIMSIPPQSTPEVSITCGDDWIAITALCIALGALIVSILTFYVRDAHRGKLRMWFPDPNRGLPQDTLAPYLDIVNMSPFDIRVVRLYAMTEDGNTYDLPGPFGEFDEFPKEIGARHSTRVQLHHTSFYELEEKKLKIIAETDTGKRFYPRRGDMKKLNRYIQTVVVEQSELANEKQKEIIRSFRPNFRSPE